MKKKKIWELAGIVLVILILNHKFQWSSYIGSEELLDFLQKTVNEHLMMTIGIYLFLTIIGCVVLALPGVTFAVIAGIVFGPVLGTICCLFATTIGAMAAFLVGRFFLKDVIKPIAMKNKYLKKWLFEDVGTNAYFLLMVTRLVPIFPYNLQNFAYGVTDIPFHTYSICTFVFMFPGVMAYTIGSAGIMDKEHRILYFGIAIVLALMVTATGTYLRKHYIKEGQADKHEHSR